MKKIFLFIFLFLFMLFIPSLTVNADVGPKSSVAITLKGVTEQYFLDLLFERPLPDEEQRNIIYKQRKNRDDIETPILLKDYSEDGFISSALYRGRPTHPSKQLNNYVEYTYVPPNSFKIIIIFADNTYITSNTITTKLFTSNVIWDLTGEDLSYSRQKVGTIEEKIPFQNMSFDLLGRIVLTLLIEILILFLFAYKLKKSYLLVLIVNIITQTILTIFMFQARYFFMPFLGEIMALIIGEILILIIEGLTYRKLLTEHSKRRARFYNFAANFASFILGIILVFISNIYF